MSLSEDIAQLTKTLRAAHESRVADLGARRDAVDKQLAHLQAEHREKAATQRKELHHFAETLRRTVATLIRDLDVERARLNADQRQRLDTFTSNLRQDVANFLHERATERRAADASQRQSLDDFLNDLRKRTSSFLAEVHATRAALHADQSSAHQAWQQFNVEIGKSRAEQPGSSADAAQRDEVSSQAPKRRPGKRQHKTPQE
jgi:predicted DNA-binding ribbon-helix-helix protein